MVRTDFLKFGLFVDKMLKMTDVTSCFNVLRSEDTLPTELDYVRPLPFHCAPLHVNPFYIVARTTSCQKKPDILYLNHLKMAPL